MSRIQSPSKVIGDAAVAYALDYALALQEIAAAMNIAAADEADGAREEVDR